MMAPIIFSGDPNRDPIFVTRSFSDPVPDPLFLTRSRSGSDRRSMITIYYVITMHYIVCTTHPHTRTIMSV